ncbi:bark storage protein A-like isoform X1 [Miscanthus floridulus]|uniref:bark storage protein A-like isoform X1 n=1 Tax=Miscanthus floridulus TaxID=154761 RepID=UPI003457CC2E
MALSGYPETTPLQLLLFSLLLLLAGSVAALPARPAMDRARWQVDRVNRRGPSLGLVMSYVDEATALQASGYFTPWRVLPFVDLYGRRYHIGGIRGVNVIYALTGQRRVLKFERDSFAFTFCVTLPSCLPLTTCYLPSLVFQLNAAVTVQTLIDVFSVSGIVHYGTAGSSNDSMSFGDVSVPKLVAYTGAWTWKKFKSPKESSAELSFGEYNIPNGGENLLGSLKYRNEELYSVGKPMEEVFWLPVDSAWFRIAEQLKVKLERCNDTFCLPTTPKVVYGLKGSSADMFLDNAEYRKFLFREFGVSTVDEESAAVVMTTTSAGIPVIVFRGVSDLAGGEPTWSSTSLMNLASINALKVAVEFIATVGKQKSTVCISTKE